MNELIDFISQPWHWAVSGSMIAMLMVLLLIGGEKFGLSTSYETFCSLGGGGKLASYFNKNWKDQSWLIVLAIGATIGGWIASTLLQSDQPVQVSAATVEHLATLGISAPTTTEEGLGFAPREIFNFEMLGTLRGLIILIGGGFLIGFGSRYAGGCTSGHAISGLANLQLPSLIAVIGFFIGGLLVSHFLLPFILTFNLSIT